MKSKWFMQKVTALFLCIILLSVSAASVVYADESPDDLPDEKTEEAVREEADPEDGTETDGGMEEEEEYGPWDSEIPEAELKYHLYNGYAWITRVEKNFEDEDFDWLNPPCEDACYDKRGRLLFTLPEGVRPASVFYNGYALVMEKNEQGNAFVTGVINTSGETVFTAEDIGADGFVFGIYENQNSEWDSYQRENSGNLFTDFTELRPVEDRFLEEGYLFAYTSEESYKGVEFKVGVVDMNGDWIVPLDEENIATTDNDYSPGAMLRGLSYCGEGVWFRLHSGPQEWFYSLEANDWQRYIGEGDDGDFIFSGGRAIAISRISSDMSYLYPPKAGDKLLQYEDIEIKYSEEDGYTYFYCYDADAHIIYAYLHPHEGHDNIIAFDDDLNELFRTELYEVYPFENSSRGYLPVSITNNKGTEFWAILGPDGEFVFEPLKEEHFRCSRFVMDDDLAVFWTDGGQFFSDGCCVYNTDGEEIFSAEPDDWERIDYHNGVLRLQPEYADEETEYVLLRQEDRQEMQGSGNDEGPAETDGKSGEDPAEKAEYEIGTAVMLTEMAALAQTFSQYYENSYLVRDAELDGKSELVIHIYGDGYTPEMLLTADMNQRAFNGRLSAVPGGNNYFMGRSSDDRLFFKESYQSGMNDMRSYYEWDGESWVQQAFYDVMTTEEDTGNWWGEEISADEFRNRERNELYDVLRGFSPDMSWMQIRGDADAYFSELKQYFPSGRKDYFGNAVKDHTAACISGDLDVDGASEDIYVILRPADPWLSMMTGDVKGSGAIPEEYACAFIVVADRWDQGIQLTSLLVQDDFGGELLDSDLSIQNGVLYIKGRGYAYNGVYVMSMDLIGMRN